MLRACPPAARRRPRRARPEGPSARCVRRLSGRGGAPPAARAQARPAPASPTDGDVPIVTATRQERIGPFHLRYSGGVEFALPARGFRLSADVVDHYLDRHHVTAAGHVVFVT